MNIITHQFYINRSLSRRETQKVQSDIGLLPGVLQCALDTEGQTMEVTYDNELCSEEELQEILQTKSPFSLRILDVHIQTLVFLLLLYALIFILSDRLHLFAASQWVLYILAGLLGLMTPLYRLREAETTPHVMATHALFHDPRQMRHPGFILGRTLGYALIGFLLGTLGHVLRMTLPGLLAGVQVFLALYILVLGLYLLGVRGLKGLHQRIPAYKGHLEVKGRFTMGLKSVLIPMVSFQAMQLFVVGYASPATGALLMLILTLASLPLMIEDETLYRQGKGTLIRRVTVKLSVLVLMLGLLLLGRGLSSYGVRLSGVPGYPHLKGLIQPQEPSIRHGVALRQEERQFINIRITEDGFDPALIYAERGIPLTLRFYNYEDGLKEELYFTPPGTREILLDSITDITFHDPSEDITFYNYFSTKVGRIHVSENPHRSALSRGHHIRRFLEENFDRSTIFEKNRDVTGMIQMAQRLPQGQRQILDIVGKDQVIEPFLFVVEVGIPVRLHLALENFEFEDDELGIFRVEDGSHLADLPATGATETTVIFPRSGLYALVDHDHILAVFSVDADIQSLTPQDIHQRYFGDR